VIESYPLTWPHGQPRTQARTHSRFKINLARSRDALSAELRLLGARDIVISSNVELRRDGLPYANSREPVDPAVAVYFERKARPFVIACDTYARVADNLRAVGMTVSALRTIHRHGASSMLEQAFSGFAALPAAFREKPWWEVLGVSEKATSTEIREAWLELTKIHHPDLGGDSERMAEINAAYQRSRS
jgi:hypothetical protein